MKNCPFCAEEIQDAAIKCKHCGERLDTAADQVLESATKEQPLPATPDLKQSVATAPLPREATSPVSSARVVQAKTEIRGVANPAAEKAGAGMVAAPLGCGTFIFLFVLLAGSTGDGNVAFWLSAIVGGGLFAAIMAQPASGKPLHYTSECPHCSNAIVLLPAQFSGLQKSGKPAFCAACKNAYGITPDGANVEQVAVGVKVQQT